MARLLVDVPHRETLESLGFLLFRGSQCQGQHHLPPTLGGRQSDGILHWGGSWEVPVALKEGVVWMQSTQPTLFILITCVLRSVSIPRHRVKFPQRKPWGLNENFFSGVRILHKNRPENSQLRCVHMPGEENG